MMLTVDQIIEQVRREAQTEGEVALRQRLAEGWTDSGANTARLLFVQDVYERHLRAALKALRKLHLSVHGDQWTGELTCSPKCEFAAIFTAPEEP